LCDSTTATTAITAQHQALIQPLNATEHPPHSSVLPPSSLIHSDVVTGTIPELNAQSTTNPLQDRVEDEDEQAITSQLTQFPQFPPQTDDLQLLLGICPNLMEPISQPNHTDLQANSEGNHQPPGVTSQSRQLSPELPESDCSLSWKEQVSIPHAPVSPLGLPRKSVAVEDIIDKDDIAHKALPPYIYGFVESLQLGDQLQLQETPDMSPNTFPTSTEPVMTHCPPQSPVPQSPLPENIYEQDPDVALIFTNIVLQGFDPNMDKRAKKGALDVILPEPDEEGRARHSSIDCKAVNDLFNEYITALSIM
ncbi:hypothetical protein M422DRAFT_275806, partial [Sphaerobolus stellatus SS14]